MIDFKKINSAALANFVSLLNDWLPDGKLVVSEYCALNPTRCDSRPGSFQINVHKGVWMDYATDDAGSDPVSLYAYLFHNNNQGAAARALAPLLGIEIKPGGQGKVGRKNSKPSRSAADVKPKNSKPGGDSPWVALAPAPAGLSAPIAHPIRGLPAVTYEYRAIDGAVLGYVYRFVKADGSKETLPLTWCRHAESGREKWHWKQWPEPRPLYGLDRLAGRDDVSILITEGEKCADVAAAQLPGLVCLSWSGGTNAVQKADWERIAGRKIIIWPDCDSARDKNGVLRPEADQPGYKAAQRLAEILLGLECRVWVMSIPAPGTMPDGWDIADAVASGCIGDQLEHFIRQKSVFFAPARAENGDIPYVPASAGGGGSFDFPPSGDSDVDFDPEAWKRALIRQPRGGIQACMENVSKLFQLHPDCRGLIGFNEFAQAIEKLRATPWGTPAGQWSDEDDLAMQYWISDKCDFLIPNTNLVMAGVSHASKLNKFHPPRQFLEALPPWDGVDRLTHYLADITSNDNSIFLQLAGRYFIRAMIARIYQPGCKFDYILVLEGQGGIGKSTFFSVLADPWFSDSPIDIGSDESAKAIQNIWLHEIAEMHAFSKAEDSAFKGFASRMTDRLRWNYEKRFTNVPRVCLFGGTVNLDQYLKDPTGNRRIWPVRCRAVDTDLLHTLRPLLFAQGLAEYRAGERFYPTRDEEFEYFYPEQELRLMPDGWEELILTWLNDKEQEAYNWFTANQILMHACKVEKSKIDENRMTLRIGRIMQRIGWERVRQPRGNRFWGYQRPYAFRLPFKLSAEHAFSNPYFD